MGDAENNNLHLLIGDLSATVRATSDGVSRLTSVVEGLSRDSQANLTAFSSLESGLKHTNSDIRAMRETMLTPEHLRSLGLHVEEAKETKRDLEHLRALRTSADERKPIGYEIRKTVAVAAVMGALAWIGPKVWEAARTEVKSSSQRDIQPAQEKQAKSNDS